MNACCCWVLENAEKGKPAKYCGKKVSYYYVKEEDGLRYRKRYPFCTEHMEKAVNEDYEDELGLD